MEEIFKDIPTYGGRYQVSNFGRVWSTVRNQFLKPQINKDGYYQYKLYCGDGRRKTEMAHRLVAITFIDNPNRLPQINHRDENKANNCVDNLEWCSADYNNKYGTRLEHFSKSISESRKKPVLQFDLHENFIKEYPSIKDAENENKIATGHISKVCKGTRKTAGGFIWKYKK